MPKRRPMLPKLRSLHLSISCRPTTKPGAQGGKPPLGTPLDDGIGQPTERRYSSSDTGSTKTVASHRKRHRQWHQSARYDPH
jgi:hypothetical protein